MDAPKLEILTGPLKSSTYSLPAGDVTVGRGDENLVKIPHSSVSRQHCVFHQDKDGAISVRDLGSRNGTLVNGALITGERQLNPGDEIHVGTSLLILTSAESSQPKALIAVDGNGSRFLTQDTIQAAPITAQVVRLLDALLKASVALGTARSFLEWEAILLDSVFALTGASRAGVATPDSLMSGSQHTIEGRTREAREMRCSLSLPASLVRRATSQNQVLMDRVGDSAVIVAPIRAAAGAGILYLEGPTFSEDELHAVAAVATLCGLAWERVTATTQLEAENRRLWSQIEHDLIGESESAGKLIEFISKVAPVASNVLLLGESGTGKDLVAKAIHRNSPRAGKPYIAVNCGAVPPSLIESELFGVERGAFTGAMALRKGLFEAAQGGTILLDEISELPLQVQPALLRVLQNRELRRLGGTRTIPVDFRLIAASNRDLAKMVEQGRFRPDLYHRLSVVMQTILPLRERHHDIPVLAKHFLTRLAGRSRPSCKGFSKAALSALSAYRWPGNVRELENAIERAVVLGDSDLIEISDLPDSIQELAAISARSGRYHEGVADAKRRLIQEALHGGGSFVEAAHILGVQPNYLHRLVTNLGLRPASDAALAEAAGEAPVSEIDWSATSELDR